VAPLRFEGYRFLLVTLEDISREKYRERMERTFFHDIMNSAGVLQGVAEIIEMAEDLEEVRETLPILKQGAALLVEEIEAQRSLLSAEKGTLRVDLVPLEGESFMRKIAEEMRSFPEISRNKKIGFLPPKEPCFALGDALIFRRVLLNMMKNALEATPKGGHVSVGCERRKDAKGDHILFWVHNRGVMAEDVQHRIFQRSFSTKGEGRGIGTYSMKLFMVQYLKGDIWFVSNEEEGTLFYAALPAWNTEKEGGAICER
jgi:signal transduction histidine kinase